MPKVPRLTASEAEALLLKAGCFGYVPKEVTESTIKLVEELWVPFIAA